jgi:hypothetical protein
MRTLNTSSIIFKLKKNVRRRRINRAHILRINFNQVLKLGEKGFSSKVYQSIDG